MTAPKYNASIENRYWVEDSIGRAWPPGQDVFTGENNPKANYALDLNIDGQVMTFIPNSVIENGVYSPFKDSRISGKSYTLPWFLDSNNQAKLNEVGQKIDLSNSDVGGYLKDKMGASTQGVLVPKGSIPFDSKIVNTPGKVTGIGNIEGQNVYLNEDTNNQGRTFYIDPAGTRKEFIQGGGGGFLSDIGLGGIEDFASGLVGGASNILKNAGDFVGKTVDYATENPLETAALVAAAYYGPAAFESLAGGGTAGTAGALDLGGGITMGADGAIAGGTFNGSGASFLGEAGGLTGAGAGTALADVGAGEALSGIDLGGVGAAPNTLLGAGEYAAAVPAAIAGAGMIPGAIGGAAAGSALADILPYTAGAQVAGSLLQADAAKDAANQQTAAANAAIAQQQKNFETINAQQAPYRAAGYNALNNIAGMTAGQTPQYDASGNIVKDANGNPVMNTGSGYFQHQFDATDLAKGLAPNYDFMLGQGQMANQRAANMGGGAVGGNALQGLNKYTQDYAGNAYQNAFTNYQNQRSNIYNTLAGIAGIGQTGQNATNTAATNATNAATQLGVGSAGAQAAGTVGSANAYSNALNNVTNQYTLAALLNQGGRVVG